MKLKQLFIVGVSLAMATICSLADDSMIGSTITRPSKKSTSTEGPAVDRTVEARIGPRVSFLTGQLLQGSSTTPVDIWGGLNLHSPNVGIQLDTDYQPINRWHLELGATYDRYDQVGVTTVNVTNEKGTIALAGDTIKVSGDLYTAYGKFGYDAIKTNWYRLRPYVGGKAMGVNGLVTGSGNTLNAGTARTNKLNVGTRDYKSSYVNGSYLIGADQRFYITPVSSKWYAGVDANGSVWNDYYYLGGGIYSGFDFSKAWGVRIGYDANYVNYKNNSGATSGTPLLGAAYIQIVAGF